MQDPIYTAFSELIQNSSARYDGTLFQCQELSGLTAEGTPSSFIQTRGVASMVPKYPDIIVKLTDEDGNAFSVLGRCRKAAEDAGVSDEEINAFMKEATSGDYENLLQTVMRWFETV
jgi:hypothetical protein